MILHDHDIPSRSIIGYLPVINASPNELATVCKLLKQCIAKADRIHQESTILTLDQAIYAKAKETVWKNPDNYKRIVLKMGHSTFILRT